MSAPTRPTRLVTSGMVELAAGALAVGGWTNPSAFLVLALRPDAYDAASFRAASVASFVLTTVGFTGVAASVVRRRLAP